MNLIPNLIFSMGKRKFVIDTVWNKKDERTIEFHEVGKEDKTIVRKESFMKLQDLQFEGISKGINEGIKNA